jgi:hypothetical protein
MVRARTATDPCLWGEGEGDKSGAFAAEAKNVYVYMYSEYSKPVWIRVSH